jgi:hypothetical protein
MNLRETSCITNYTQTDLGLNAGLYIDGDKPATKCLNQQCPVIWWHSRIIPKKIRKGMKNSGQEVNRLRLIRLAPQHKYTGCDWRVDTECSGLCGAKRVAGLKQGTCGWSRLFDIEISDEARDACLGKPRALTSETAIFQNVHCVFINS